MTKVLLGNLKGPKGDKGDKGDSIKGDPGPAGPNTVPTNQAIADAVSTVGPAKAALTEIVDVEATTAVPLTRFYDVSNPPTTYDAALLAAIDTGRPVYIPPGEYPASLSVVNKSVRLTGPGTLVQREGTSVLEVTATPTGPWAVANVGTILWRNLARASESVPIVEMLATINLTNPAHITQFASGDKLLLQSDQRYAGDYVTGYAALTYKGGWADIVGIAVKVNTPGNIPIRSTITGATSGASAIVAAVTVDYDGAVWAIIDRTTAPFTPGEVLRIAGGDVGTAGNAGTLLSARLMEDTTYGGALKVWKGRKDVVVDLDIAIRTQTDPERVGQAERRVSVTLEGIIDMKVSARMHNGYKAAFVLMSCFAGEISVRGGNLPNIESQDAFGYAVMARGATELTRVHVDVENVRHAFTTNCYPLNSPPTDPAIVLRTIGTSKHLTVSGTGRSCTAAAFDTHAGGWMIHFNSAQAIGTSPAGKDAAVNVGFQNRSFGTIYTDCTALDCEIGFLDHTYRWAAERDNVIVHKGSSAIRYRQFGFFHGTTTNVGSTALGSTRYLLDSTTMVAAVHSGTAFYKQISYCLGAAATTLVRPVSRGAAHADVQIRAEIPQLTIVQPFFDHQNTAAPAMGSGYVIDAQAGIESSRRMVIDSMTLLDNLTGNARRSVFHVETGVTLRVRRPAPALGLFQMVRPTGPGPVLNDGAGTLDAQNNATI